MLVENAITTLILFGEEGIWNCPFLTYLNGLNRNGGVLLKNRAARLATRDGFDVYT